MELGDVLAGKARRRRKEQDQPMIDDCPFWIAQGTIGSLSRLGHRSGNRFDSESDTLAGDPDHRDTGAPGAGGQRHNGRIGFRHMLSPGLEFRR